MRFADPQSCPDCRGVIAGQPVCPHCGLELTSLEMRQLWQTLQRADELLDAAVRARDAARAVVPEPVPAPQPVAPPVPPLVPAARLDPQEPAVPAQPATPPAPNPFATWSPEAYPAPEARAKERKRISAGAVLLGLGALGMVVAAFIFLTVSWGSLGVAGRAAVLLAVTAVVGGAAAWATRRPLRGSAEALWTIFLAMASLDWFVACDQGLLGLDALSGRATTIVWAVAVAAIGTLVVARGRTPLGRDLVAPMIVSGVGAVVGAAVVAAELEAQGVNLFWSTTAAMVLAAGATAVFVRVRQRVSVLIAGAFAVLTIAAAVTLAVIEVLSHPAVDELVTGGHGVPMLVVIASLVTVGATVSRATTVASAVAGGAAVFLVAVPAEEAAAGRGALVVVSLAAGLGALLLAGAGSWRRGGRALVGALTTGLVLVALVGCIQVAEAASDGLEAMRSAPIDARPTDVAGPWWLVLVVTAALVAVVLGGRRWPEATTARRHLVPLAWVVAAAGAVVTVGAAEPAYVVTAAVLMAASIVLVVALDRYGLPWQLVPAVGVGMALGASLSHDVASAIVWAVGAIVLAGLSARVSDRFVRDGLTLLSAATAVGVVAFTLDVAGVEGTGLALGLVLTAAALSAVALALRGQRGVPVEIVAGITMLVGLMLAASDSAPDVRASIFVTASALLLLLSLGAGRDDDAWWTVDRPQAYRGGGVAAMGGAMLAGLPASDVCLVVWSGAALALGALSWRVAHPVERAIVTVLSPLAAVGALGFALDLAGAQPQTFALSFVAAAAVIVRTAGALRGGRERPVELAAGVTLVVALLWTSDVPDPVWRAVTWTVAGVLLIAASLLRSTWSLVDRATVLRVTGSLVLGVGMLLPLPDARDSLGFWIGGAVVLALVSWRSPHHGEAGATAFAAAVATTGVAALALDVLDASSEVSSLVLVLIAATLCAVGALENGMRRLPVESAAAPTAGLGLMIAIDGTGLSWVALVLTALGALSVLLGLLGGGSGPYRRPAYRAVGATSLALAYVLRLVASDVDVVEAYTLPFGLILLAAGAWTLHRDAATSSLLTLGPGLTLVLLPSLPQALADPTGPRALLLGLGALVVLVVGVARNLQVPFVLGGLVFAVLVVVNIGPYAFALPRWTLIAGASALLLGAGITWEDRVRDGRAVVRFVTSMR